MLALSLGTLVALQIAAGFALQLVVLALVGAGLQTDAWVAAQAVPLVITSIVAVSLQGAWQSRLAVLGKDPVAWKIAQQTAQGQLLLVFGGAALALAASASVWTKWLFPGFTAEQISLTARITQILLVGAAFNSQATLLMTGLRGRGQFVGPEVIMLGGAITTILAAFVVIPLGGIEWVAWVSAARSLVVWAVLFWLSDRPAPSLVLAWHDSERWNQIRPILLGSAYYKTGPLVDRYWSSQAPPGGMTMFNLAQTGMGALAAVLDRAFCAPITPSLARLAAAGDLMAMRGIYRKSLRQIAVVALIVLLALGLVYPLWPAITFSMLKLGPAAAFEAWLICTLLVAYLYPAAAGSVVVASLYALGDVRTPVKVGIVGFSLSLPLKAAGFMFGGLVGLALATVAHYLGNMLAMTWLLERRLARVEPTP
jgi:putative peptidoglycan lipid II flippase